MANVILKLKLTINDAVNLLSSISHEYIKLITYLELDGQINAINFETMRDYIYSLIHTKLTKCDIDGSCVYKIPDTAFTHYIGQDEFGDKVYHVKRWLRKAVMFKSVPKIKHTFLSSDCVKVIAAEDCYPF